MKYIHSIIVFKTIDSFERHLSQILCYCTPIMNYKVMLSCGVLLVCLSCLYFGGVFSEYQGKEATPLRFASYYQDNMVLQASPHRAIIWGYGEKNGVVEILLTNTYKMYSTKVNNVINGTGVWSITLDPQQTGTRVEIEANQLSGGKLSFYRISNVIFGDVWICGGQSNMLFPVAHSFNFTEILQTASNYPDIRIFTVRQTSSPTPLYDLKGITQDWAVSSSDSVLYFSAVCWLYARTLYDKLHTPIGLISSNWGGTPVEAWSSPRALSLCGLSHINDNFISMGSDHPVFPPLLETVPYFRDQSSSSNSVLWNAMIHPFLNMTIKGVIWYQGEANARYHRDNYNCSFPAMINDWRKFWSVATASQTEELFAFGFVQIGTMSLAVENDNFPMIRWHQTADHGYAPNADMSNTFMAVALDLPDPDSPYGSVHSRYKKDEALRLSAAALKYVYKVENFDDGPFPTIAKPLLKTIHVAYSKPNIKVYNDTKENFEICCSDNICDVSDTTQKGLSEWVPAKLLSHDDMSVTISADNCAGDVKRVRYAWASTPCKFKKCQVYNNQGFPAPPFVMGVTLK